MHFDGVLLFGPLYHLTDREERLIAIREARRVLHPDGILLVNAISRFASLLDGLRQGFLADPDLSRIVERDLGDGLHLNPTARIDYFTTSFFHHPHQLSAELEEAGLRVLGIFPVEGPGWFFEDVWHEPGRREQLLTAIKAIEREPTTLGVSAHMTAKAAHLGQGQRHCDEEPQSGDANSTSCAGWVGSVRVCTPPLERISAGEAYSWTANPDDNSQPRRESQNRTSCAQ